MSFGYWNISVILYSVRPYDCKRSPLYNSLGNEVICIHDLISSPAVKTDSGFHPITTYPRELDLRFGLGAFDFAHPVSMMSTGCFIVVLGLKQKVVIDMSNCPETNKL